MNEFINADCVAAMRLMPNNNFDLAIVDPPYGIKINMNMGLRRAKRPKHARKKWDNEPPTAEYFEQLFRVSRNQIIWGGNYFDLPPNRHFIFWDKLVPATLSFSAGEYAWTSFDQANAKFTAMNRGNGNKYHPTQ